MKMSDPVDPGGGRSEGQGSPDNGNSQGRSGSQNRSNRNSRTNRRGNNDRGDRPANAIEELGTAYYRAQTNADTFTATTRTIAE